MHARAPAKLNLSLRVLGKRPDGYHDIETLFERIDLCDELLLEPHPDALQLTCTDPALSCGEDNLILQSARLLQQAGGASPGASIHLIKRIPVAAGLGGGSSDAAAALRGLNRLWQLGLTQAQLIELGARIGSDVPFFLDETSPFAVGTGRGEQCRALVGALRLAHVLVVPDARLSTKDIYEGFDGHLAQRPFTNTPRPLAGRFDLTAPKPSIIISQHALCNGSLGELARGLWNDLEPEAIRRCPVIASIKTRLHALGCLAACLSGSGPSVFGVCRDEPQAREIAATLQREHHDPAWRIELVRTDKLQPTTVHAP